MIKSLREARLKDGLPRVVAGLDWVSALSEAIGGTHEQTIDFTDGSQIYTAIDNVSEAVLDALAVNWKVDWYDTNYSVEQKRRIIKTALTARRKMGTVGAVRSQAEAIYPNTTIKEWFDYGGEPGYFRMIIDGEHVTLEGLNGLYRAVDDVKRLSAWLEQTEIIVHPSSDESLRVGGRMGLVARLPVPLLPDDYPEAEAPLRIGGIMAAEYNCPVPEAPDAMQMESALRIGGSMAQVSKMPVPEASSEEQIKSTLRLGGSVAQVGRLPVPEITIE